MPVGSASRVALVESECTNIGGNSVPFKMSVKYLGVHLDQTLSMRQYIDSVCRASFLELRRAATNRPYLSQSGTARLVTAMIISRLNYCNSVFAGLRSRPGRSVRENPEQCSTACYGKKKTRSRYTSPQRTLLVTCEIPLPV